MNDCENDGGICLTHSDMFEGDHQSWFDPAVKEQA